MMRILIVGDGLAGRIAYHALKGIADNISVMDMSISDGVTKNHHAVLRIRDPKTALYLGADVEEIDVVKGLVWDGQILDKASLMHNNLYSQKVGHTIEQKSISNLAPCKRYLIKNIPSINPEHICRAQQFVGWSEKDTACFKNVDTEELSTVKYDVMVSTAPLPVMLNAAGIEFSSDFELIPIHVYTGKVLLPSNVHQTLYFPDPDINVYRATLQGQRFIIEATGPLNTDSKNYILQQFGLRGVNEASWDPEKVQHNGKMKLISEDSRKSYIAQLTDNHNVFSFGRFAIWKPIRTDHLTSDIERIKTMVKSKYQVNKHRVL